MMKLTIKTKSGRVKAEYEDIAPSDKIGTLKSRFQFEFGISTNRQRFTYIKPGTDPKLKKNQIALTDDSKSFDEYITINTNAGDITIELIYKDLGLQIAWRTVFLVEYFGPMLMHSACYLAPSLFYSSSSSLPPKSLTQKVAFGMTMIHYLKRELETLFVHRFSNGTMPIMNIFKNSFHYWILGGISVSYFLYHPQYTAPFQDNKAAIYGITAMWALCEYFNLDAHLRLRNLRPPGTKKRGIPKGQMFEMVSCANYFWEIWGWCWFALLTNTYTGWFFCIVGGVQMYFWAIKKHRRYKTDFRNYPKGRKALIPYIA